MAKCLHCDGEGKISHPITLETRGPEEDAKRMEWARRNKIVCPMCGGSGQLIDVGGA